MSRTHGDRQTFRNEDLVLRVTTDIDPAVWDEARYEPFLSELCGSREYQVDAIAGIDASLKERKGDPVKAELDIAMKRIGS